MKDTKMDKLYDLQASADFYEQRYKDGYMVDWPEERKQRISEIVRGLNLPETGVALDFGCGNGVLTEIIRQALPAWKVCGTDLSHQAVNNARARFPACTFFLPSEAEQYNGKVDLVFSNHVIEHVYNLEEVFCEMDRYLKSAAGMLHFLPCGNVGSFEYRLCLLRKDGINSDLGNRFFYEDEGHVRRLSTTQFAELASTRGFKLSKEFYANQQEGAIDWITSSLPKLVWLMTSGHAAVDLRARVVLFKLRLWLMSLTLVSLPARIIQSISRKPRKGPLHQVLRILALPFYPLSIAVDTHLKQRAAAEWQSRRHEQSGSEMVLFFSR